MRTRTPRPSSLLAVLCLAIPPAAAAAQTIPPACRALVEAERRQILTPHHTYATQARAGANAKPVILQMISTRDATYMQVRGVWRRLPMTPRDELARLDRNLATATTLTCQRMADDVVDGVPAAVYSAHTENQGVRGDSRTWIAARTGLILRQEEDVNLGGASGAQHLSMRFDYANVRAPAGAD